MRRGREGICDKKDIETKLGEENEKHREDFKLDARNRKTLV
jgi:hypothetical protein